jgi:hypothetical protein
MSSATLLLIQPRPNQYVLRLYNCIVTRLEILWSVEHAASQVSTFISPKPPLTQKAPPAWTGLEGQGEAAGSDRPRGRDNFTIIARIGAHY